LGKQHQIPSDRAATVQRRQPNHAKSARQRIQFQQGKKAIQGCKKLNVNRAKNSSKESIGGKAFGHCQIKHCQIKDLTGFQASLKTIKR